MDTNSGRCVLDPAWRRLVIEDARGWLGTPYQHKCRVKHVGVDCGGLLYQVYNPYFGPFRPFPKHYAPDWALHRENEMYLDFIAPYTKQIRNPVPGGIAVFQVGRNFSHGTICAGNGKFIHAWGRNQSGSVVESGLNFFSLGGKLRKVQYFDVVK